MLRLQEKASPQVPAVQPPTNCCCGLLALARLLTPQAVCDAWSERLRGMRFDPDRLYHIQACALGCVRDAARPTARLAAARPVARLSAADASAHSGSFAEHRHEQCSVLSRLSYCCLAPLAAGAHLYDCGGTADPAALQGQRRQRQHGAVI